MDRESVGKDEMTDAIANGLTPAEEDPILHRYLNALPAAVPMAGLSDRVLSGVWRPAPRWIRTGRAAMHDMTASGRIWLVIGALAVGSLVPLAAAVVLVGVFAESIGGGLRWLVAEGIPFAWVAFTADLQGALGTVASVLVAHGLTRADLLAGGIGAAVTTLGCAIGLRRTMTPSRKETP
ncbi:MAG: hypothetical protein OEO20_07280 [Gemmatimonadota bacterium]|nr:hypothetical protein [Gemmatimonadota bacterium]MDH3366672.1 hypothetical protein [Gemmatimonadota bacterium]MDH3478091.1 hypothetical protein [Gemmatimonadota bacterium]MDH3570600.1 hypothetical protein [Gemmatimonadota bacterium]MDH5549427.1 hypothetical protein [Gemmatimonadota bacterium]